MIQKLLRRASVALAATGLFLTLGTAHAGGGDLLVAPTRVVLDGPRGAEVVLNNIGEATATYRVSLEIKRMTAEGALEEIDPNAVNDAERQTLAMLLYSPRRVTLPPNQPQTIRISVRPPAGLPDGEYRAHMLFRAVPESRSVSAPATPTSGVSISLTPIYGVSIPIIVRQGRLEATAAIANARLEAPGTERLLRFDLSKQGNRSVYGEVIVTRPGVAEPLVAARGVAIYPEIDQRVVTLPLSQEQYDALHGPVTIRFVEDREVGNATLAELSTVLR